MMNIAVLIVAVAIAVVVVATLSVVVADTSSSRAYAEDTAVDTSDDETILQPD
uniref:Uncharacterized protein n=1 Tax=Peronospora matthiolae TaxID=2874970 RepID=A0AAV1THP4_9STRA